MEPAGSRIKYVDFHNGFECNLNQFLSRCSYAAAILRCLTVCLSVIHVHCDKTKATAASIVISYEKLSHVVLAVLRHE